MAISKGCKPHNCESHYSVKLTFEAFVRIFLIVNLFLNQTLLTFLLYVKHLDDSLDSGYFSVMDYRL